MYYLWDSSIVGECTRLRVRIVLLSAILNSLTITERAQVRVLPIPFVGAGDIKSLHMGVNYLIDQSERRLGMALRPRRFWGVTKSKPYGS